MTSLFETQLLAFLFADVTIDDLPGILRQNDDDDDDWGLRAPQQ